MQSQMGPASINASSLATVIAIELFWTTKNTLYKSGPGRAIEPKKVTPTEVGHAPSNFLLEDKIMSVVKKGP